MISVREAVDIAKQSCIEVFNTPGTVEEVAIEGGYWFITLSFEETSLKKPKNKKPSSTTGQTFMEMSNWLNQTKVTRKYRIFKIDAETKQVISVKIHQL